MKTRVISSIVATVLLFAVFFSGKVVFALSIFALTVIAAHEFINAGSAGNLKAFKPIVYLSSIVVLITGLKDYLPILKSYSSTGMVIPLTYIIFASVLAALVFKYGKFKIEDAGFTLFTIFYVVFMFSFLPLIRNIDKGFYLIWIVFIGAWCTDTFAYLVGVSIGKHKMLPRVSPKKSYEGFFGGIIGCIIATTIYGYFLITKNIVSISIIYFVIIGFLNGILSQIGDWIASAIKRYVNIKDYGKIMPGHGGVLDRFDSILFISPFVYLFLTMVINNI